MWKYRRLSVPKENSCGCEYFLYVSKCNDAIWDPCVGQLNTVRFTLIIKEKEKKSVFFKDLTRKQILSSAKEVTGSSKSCLPSFTYQNDLFLTLGLGTSNARIENLRPLLNTNIPLISGNYGLRNHF